jgi:hypothetical protein
VLAGMDLRWETLKNLAGLSTAMLETAFALSILLDTFDDEGKHLPGNAREWAGRIFLDHPEIVETVCRTLLTERLRQHKSIGTLVQRMPGPGSVTWRSEFGARLLLEYTPEDAKDLHALCLMAAESEQGCEQLVISARARVFGESVGWTRPDLFWIAVGFILIGNEFDVRLSAAAKSHRETLWMIRALTGPPNTGLDLSLRQMDLVIRAFGGVFPNSSQFSSAWGNESDEDAATYLGELTTIISTRPEFEAGACLAGLLQNPDLASYHPWISCRLAEQRELNRRSRYQRPTWRTVCAALKGGAPANIADLKALFLDSLADSTRDIRHSNLDRYRVYWHGGRGKTRPQDEEYCRDRLVEYLRERLKPVGIWVEPEGHMAADKRADIIVYAPNALKLPAELKRDTHPDLWVAAKDQLERLYTRDPNAQGYGVYLVFYFGAGRGGSITRHPDGIPISDSAEDLEKALNAAVPVEHRARIACFVLDVSPPALPKSKSLKKRKGKTRKGNGAPAARRSREAQVSKQTEKKRAKRNP